MVDAIVSYAVERLGDFLIGEAVFLHEVKDEVVWLQNELRWMQSFLKDAEEKQDADERIRVWVSEIRDIAYSTEDVIDTFLLNVKGVGRTNSKKGWSTTSLKSCFCISAKVAGLYDLGKTIKVLKKRVLDLSRKREVYGISNISDAQEGASSGGTSVILRQLRRTTSYADDEQVVGLEDDAQLLEEKLTNDEPRRSVISILGMGGLGKTTLARKLYNNNDVKLMFDCKAWICVSQDWRTRDLLGRIIKSFKKLTKDELEEMSDEDMERCLRELLKRSRYLVVIDDVWHREAWESLKRALPDNKNGSRIIITTRIESVAELSDQRTYVHKLRFLRADESWELFCKKAFPDHNNIGSNTYHCPPDIEKLGGEMVAKCDGLPLAIIVLGGILARKQPHEWLLVKEHIWRELKNDSIHVSSLLALSYKDLPHQLKPCFLYMGLFPEDFILDANKLTRLWVAEGFISKGEETLDIEEVAENYLKELIGRSLIQVVKRNWRTISTCRVHDLLRDLAINKARELNFLLFYDEVIDSAPSTMASLYRRIAFGFESYISLSHLHPHIRTLLFYNNTIHNMEPFTSMHKRFSLLRVLNLEGVKFPLEKLPDAVGKLIHLRYLGLKGTGLRELPEFIVNLQSLQTIDAPFSTKMRLPREICKLKQLRHLRGYFGVPSLLSEELTNLWSLKVVDIGVSLSQAEGVTALNPIAKLRNLKSLSLKSRASLLSVQPLLGCRHLQELKIHGSIGSLPAEMHKFLPNLKYLELMYSGLEQDPMATLEMLPNLHVLRLTYIGVDAFTFTAKGFSNLQVLWLIDEIFVKVQMEEAAMPRLRALSLDGPEKHSLPDRLRSVPAVEHLNWEWE